MQIEDLHRYECGCSIFFVKKSGEIVCAHCRKTLEPETVLGVGGSVAITSPPSPSRSSSQHGGRLRGEMKNEQHDERC